MYWLSTYGEHFYPFLYEIGIKMDRAKFYEILSVGLNVPAAVMVALNCSQLVTWIGFIIWTVGAIPLYLWNKEKGGNWMLLLPIIYFLIDGIGIIRWWPF